EVNWSPASCMPSPESPAMRITTLSSLVLDALPTAADLQNVIDDRAERMSPFTLPTVRRFRRDPRPRPIVPNCNRFQFPVVASSPQHRPNSLSGPLGPA